jgi:hypothetical protein
VRAFSAYRDSIVAVDSQRDVDRRLDALLANVSELGGVQAGYVAPGQDAAGALERYPPLVREISAGTADLGAILRSAQASQSLRNFADATASVALADARARDALLLDDVSTAAHILFGEARTALTQMTTALRAVRAAETSARAAEQTATNGRAWALAGAAALLWAGGLFLFAFLPRARRESAPPAPAAGVDLAAAADLCRAIARVDSASSLAALLDRAAALLDAPGLVLWMRAGDALAPVASSGHGDTARARFGLIQRDADHPIARAWREDELQLVHGDETSHSAILAPVSGPGACTGVLAVDLGDGRQTDQTVRAVIIMIAAQLATVVSGSGDSMPARATGT